MTQQTARAAIQHESFPSGFPRLWCPSLTHFRAARELDVARIRAHLTYLSPYVRGILVPGSTGEGWEMNDADIHGLLTTVLDIASPLGLHVLIGVLKSNVSEMLQCLDAMDAFRLHPAVVGITVCPPQGHQLTQEEIHHSLGEVLRLGWPTALYQLPQVTQNEMSASTVAHLAAEFQNFILFKDSSGSDRVAKSGLEFGGVYMLRGAEQGGYASWPRAAGGPYDGFLLSTANGFARDFSEMLNLMDSGQFIAAQSISSKLVNVVSAAFTIVADFPFGNAFANANKVVDHCMAYGNDANKIDPPLLFSGERLPAMFIDKAVAMLREHSLLPERGYYSEVDPIFRTTG